MSLFEMQKITFITKAGNTTNEKKGLTETSILRKRCQSRSLSRSFEIETSVSAVALSTHVQKLLLNSNACAQSNQNPEPGFSGFSPFRAFGLMTEKPRVFWGRDCQDALKLFTMTRGNT